MESKVIRLAAGAGVLVAVALVIMSIVVGGTTPVESVSTGPTEIDTGAASEVAAEPVEDESPVVTEPGDDDDADELAPIEEAVEIPSGDETSNDAGQETTPDFGGDKPLGDASIIPRLGPVPEITDISAWLNTDGSSFETVRGEVTIVQFWTFGCYNCKNTIPHLQALYADQHDNGLEIIGIHAHEFDRERVPENVAAAVIDLGVTWPVALDTNKTNFRAWQGSRRFWPRTYVIDAEGEIRFDHIGEGQYDELTRVVESLLAESA